jgi:hypothetical protein
MKCSGRGNGTRTMSATPGIGQSPLRRVEREALPQLKLVAQLARHPEHSSVPLG